MWHHRCNVSQASWLIESPVACDFKLRECLAWPGRYHQHTFPSLPSLECTWCTLRWDWACRVYCLRCATPRAYLVSDNKIPSWRERNHRHCVLWGIYNYLEVLVQHVIACTRVVGHPASIFPRPPICQIKKPAKFSHYNIWYLWLV